MNRFLTHTLLCSVLAACTLTLTACTPNVEGKYIDASGAISIELKSGGEATAKFWNLGGPCTYEVKGKQIDLTCNGTTTHYTVNSDGSLAGPPGIGFPNLKKTK